MLSCNWLPGPDGHSCVGFISHEGPKVKTRKINNKQETEQYVMVRESTGGRQREMSISG